MTPQPQEIWQHYKTKGMYEIVALGKLQLKLEALDMEVCVIYKAVDDGKIWVRPLADFVEEVTTTKGETVRRFEKQEL